MTNKEIISKKKTITKAVATKAVPRQKAVQKDTIFYIDGLAMPSPYFKHEHLTCNSRFGKRVSLEIHAGVSNASLNVVGEIRSRVRSWKTKFKKPRFDLCTVTKEDIFDVTIEDRSMKLKSIVIDYEADLIKIRFYK